MFWYDGYARLWNKVRPKADSTDTSFPSRVATTTEPTGDGVINLSSTGQNFVPKAIKIIPYATANNDQTFDVRIIGWQRAGTLGIGPGQAPTTSIWMPTPIAQLTVTLGSQTGIAGAPILDTQLFGDTIVVHATISLEPRTSGIASGTVIGSPVYMSPANDLIAWCLFPLYGSEKVEICFAGTVTGMNCLYALFSM